jgi:hypothetical protein
VFHGDSSLKKGSKNEWFIVTGRIARTILIVNKILSKYDNFSGRAGVKGDGSRFSGARRAQHVPAEAQQTQHDTAAQPLLQMSRSALFPMVQCR